MIVGIHQPNFLPWMGYFYKISQCDSFVFFGEAEYTKKSFIRRVKIHRDKHIDQDRYLIVPLKKHSDFAKINELELVDDIQWKRKIKAQIHQTYHKAPFYFQLEELIDVFFNENIGDHSFSTYTTSIIEKITDMLNLNIHFHRSSDMKIDGQKAKANIEMIKQLGGETYISGNGAKKYQTIEEYNQQGITLKYSDFKSEFTKMDLPNHFFNKSILAYIACVDISVLSAWLYDKK